MGSWHKHTVGLRSGSGPGTLPFGAAAIRRLQRPDRSACRIAAGCMIWPMLRLDVVSRAACEDRPRLRRDRAVERESEAARAARVWIVSPGHHDPTSLSDSTGRSGAKMLVCAARRATEIPMASSPPEKMMFQL